MLALWSAIGLIPNQFVAKDGPLLADPDCIVSAVSVQTAIPVWPRPYDPADLSPYAYNFRPILFEGERIAAVDEILVSALGREIGVFIHEDADYAPTIAGELHDHIQVWPGVEERFWDAAGFEPGLTFSIRFRFRTNLNPSRRFERRANQMMVNL